MITRAIWLAAIYPTAQPESLSNSLTATCERSKFHFSVVPLFRKAQIMPTAITMMPEVEPMPRSHCKDLLSTTSLSVGGSTLLMRLTNSREVIVTRFAKTGVQAAAKNFLCACKIEVQIEVTP